MATKVANSSVAIAMAIAGRSARACDVCANRSANWFCAADDAYLCTACDTQVHSANALSLRHERVRLSPTGTPVRPQPKSGPKSFSKVPKEEGCGAHRVKSLRHPSPPQVAPSHKRSRTSRPYSHHLKKLSLQQQMVKSEESSFVVKAELELFDFLDADEFLNDGNQEVPSLSPVADDSPCSSEFDLLSSDYEFQEGDHSASADSFAAFFKGKAAHSQSHADDSDQFLVPNSVDFPLDGEMADASASPADDNIELQGEAFFFPGDIPGLDGFESFVPEMDIRDDFSLSFDLALQNRVEAFEGDGVVTSAVTGVASSETRKLEPQADQFATGPFAKFFAQKTKAELQAPMDPARIKREAQMMLKCCRDDDDDSNEVQRVPSLQLNLIDVLAAWSDRGDPWIHSRVALNATDDAGLVPDMDAAAGDDGQSGGDRDARVLRYKEKRRTRLFSKKIRYEVRKLNAERRPRMKGRFVKRTTISS